MFWTLIIWKYTQNPVIKSNFLTLFYSDRHWKILLRKCWLICHKELRWGGCPWTITYKDMCIFSTLCMLKPVHMTSNHFWSKTLRQKNIPAVFECGMSPRMLMCLNDWWSAIGTVYTTSGSHRSWSLHEKVESLGDI